MNNNHQKNSFILASLIKLNHNCDDNDDGNYSNKFLLDSQRSSTLLEKQKKFFKSTPSLFISNSSSSNSHSSETNNNIYKSKEYIEYEFEPIKLSKPKSNPAITTNTRDLFTPDSLESSLSSSCSLSESEDSKEDTILKSKTDSGLSVSPQLTQSSTSDKQLELDFETDEEVCQLTLNEKTTTESNILLEKIDKINQLQNKINDINQKIKSIDMNNNNLNNISHYVNPSYEDDDEEYESRRFANFRERHNQTRLELRNNSADDDDDDEDDNDNEDDEDEEFNNYNDERYSDEEEFIENFKTQFQLPIKKYASTGFLFNRFGSYLAPIEEAPEDIFLNGKNNLSSSMSSLVSSTDSSDYLIQPSHLSKKSSSSCFDFKNIYEAIEASIHKKSEINNIVINNSLNNNNNATNSTTTNYFQMDDLSFNDTNDISCFIDREEFIDNSSLNNSLNLVNSYLNDLTSKGD